MLSIVGSCRILFDNSSADRTNKYGDRGHPCRTPGRFKAVRNEAIIYCCTLNIFVESSYPPLDARSKIEGV